MATNETVIPAIKSDLNVEASIHKGAKIDEVTGVANFIKNHSGGSDVSLEKRLFCLVTEEIAAVSYSFPRVSAIIFNWPSIEKMAGRINHFRWLQTLRMDQAMWGGMRDGFLGAF
jgi:hypothetical protein